MCADCWMPCRRFPLPMAPATWWRPTADSAKFAIMDSMNKLVFASFSVLFLAVVQAQDLPDGPGKDTFQKVCSACHDASVVVTMHQAKDDWQATIDDMKGRGADGSDADFKTILGYLAKYQGPEV